MLYETGSLGREQRNLVYGVRLNYNETISGDHTWACGLRKLLYGRKKT